MRTISLMVLSIFCVVVLSGCGTFKGLGEDISSVGHWFVKGSEKIENK